MEGLSMPQVEKLFVFLASPGDVLKERRHTREVLDELNRTLAAQKGLVLQVVDWEHNAIPGYGTDAQLEQRQKVLAFKKQVQANGMPWTSRNPSDFRDKFRNHMIGWLGKQSVSVPKDPRDSSRGLEFVSIGIHHGSDKYWREGECS